MSENKHDQVASLLRARETLAPDISLLSMAALDRAVAILLTQERLAAALGIRSPSISGWRRSGLVPVDWCEPVELLTGGEVSRHDLRPDIFGPAPSAHGIPDILNACAVAQKVA